MRIIKLSDEDSGLAQSGVTQFFFSELPSRTPPGKFRVTANKIKKAGLVAGERLLFTYRARVVFTALAKSDLLPNDDAERQKYPSYFVVDLATMNETDVDFYEIERQYNQATGNNVSLVQSQPWNPLEDSVHTEAIWERLRNEFAFALPEEVTGPAGLVEGAAISILVNSYERNPKARQKCIEHYGRKCCICGFVFREVYGPAAAKLIHVHHLRALAEIGKEYVVDPIKDLRPVCPNCHAVLHMRTPAYSIEDVQQFVRRHGSATGST